MRTVSNGKVDTYLEAMLESMKQGTAATPGPAYENEDGVVIRIYKLDIDPIDSVLRVASDIVRAIEFIKPATNYLHRLHVAKGCFSTFKAEPTGNQRSMPIPIHRKPRSFR